MMAVSNTSPLITLAVVEQLELLPKLYSSFVIPPAVYYELTHLTDKPAASTLATVSWLLTQAVVDTALVTRLRQHLHAGEAEAIALAIELQAPVLLMDEQRGRRIASDLGMSVTGVVGVLIFSRSHAPAWECRADALASRSQPVHHSVNTGINPDIPA